MILPKNVWMGFRDRWDLLGTARDFQGQLGTLGDRFLMLGSARNSWGPLQMHMKAAESVPSGPDQSPAVLISHKMENNALKIMP